MFAAAAGCAGGGGVGSADPVRNAADANAGRTVKYLIPRMTIYRELNLVVQARGYGIEKDIPQKAYLVSDWRYPIRIGETQPERLKVEGEVVGDLQPPFRVQIRCRREIQNPETKLWTSAGWAIDEEDALYAELHRALARYRP